MRRVSRIASFAAVALAALSHAAFANHSFCVTSSGGVGSAAQLTSALGYAVTGVDETVYVHLEQGTYTIAGDQYYNQDGNGGNASLHLVAAEQHLLDVGVDHRPFIGPLPFMAATLRVVR